MNPWAIAGGIVILGGLLVASTAMAAEDDCEIVTEYGVPYWVSAIMLRECEQEDGTVWLWDVALLEDVKIGAEWAVEEWPDRSLGFGQAATEQAAMDAAIAWVDANQGFVAGGGERGAFAERTENFLASLSPSQVDELLGVFDDADPELRGLIEQLRVAPDDESYLEVAQEIGARLQDVDQDALQQDILSAVGIAHGLTLKSLLDDAGVL